MTKYVAFDIGNVLVHADFTEFVRELSATLNITVAEATYFMNRTQKLHDLGLTNMSDELHDHFKIKSEVTMEKLIKSWNDVIKPEYKVLETITRMRGIHDVRVALLSNVGLEHSKRMEEVLGYNDFIDGCVKHFSCNVGARKPTVIYYHTFLELHPEWEYCPYIDDVQDNLDAGAQFGFKPYRFALSESGHCTGRPFQEKLNELEKFILDNQRPPEKNARWH